MLTTAKEAYSHMELMPLIEHLRVANMLLGDLVKQELSIVRPSPDPKQTTKRRQIGSAKIMITIAPDFDEPLEDFREYM
jgi:Protein of unknown function (DUF2281)